MALPAARLTAAALAAAVICTACAAPQPATTAHPRRAAPPRTAPAVTRTPSRVVLLPVSPAGLAAAATLAARFAVVYAIHEPGQSSAAWLARLRPLATPQLTAALARAAIWQARQATTATITAERIRDITTASVIIIVRLRQITASGAQQQATTRAYAITVTRQHGRGWAVYDIEPATAGNAG